MATYKASAITLRTYDFKDFDKIVVLYTREQGIVRAIAKGVKKSKSRIGGIISPMIASNIIFTEGRNLDIIQQCEIIDFFKNIKKDLVKIAIASYYLELALAFGMENDPHSVEFYDFLFSGLKQLQDAPESASMEQMLLSFEYDFISLAGYAPLLDVCTACRKSIITGEDIWMDKLSASIFCDECFATETNLIEVGQDLYQILLHLSRKTITTSDYDCSVLLRVHELLYNYVSQKTSYKLKSPKLIETLCLSYN